MGEIRLEISDDSPQPDTMCKYCILCGSMEGDSQKTYLPDRGFLDALRCSFLFATIKKRMCPRLLPSDHSTMMALFLFYSLQNSYARLKAAREAQSDIN